MSNETKKETKREELHDYIIINGSYSAFDEQGVRKKYRPGDTVKLTKDKAKKLVNIVRPANYDPKPVEAPESVKFAAEESLRPINEIGAGLPQDADEPAIVVDAKVNEVLETAAKTSAKSDTAPGTKQVDTKTPVGK